MPTNAGNSCASPSTIWCLSQVGAQMTRTTWPWPAAIATNGVGTASKDVIQRRTPLSHSLIHGARDGLHTSSGTQPDYALLGKHPLDARRSSCSTSTMTDTRVRLCAFDSVM